MTKGMPALKKKKKKKHRNYAHSFLFNDVRIPYKNVKEGVRFHCLCFLSLVREDVVNVWCGLLQPCL